MYKYKHSIIMLAMSLVCIWIAGCASFSKARLPEIGQLQPPADTSQAVIASYNFTSGSDLGGGRNEFTQNIKQLLEQEFVDQLKESGYFTSLSSGKGGRIQIDADMLNYGSGVSAMISGIIGGLSLTTIPSWVTDNYKVTVKVKSTEGKEVDYVLDDAITTVIWFPLIVATPFKSPNKVSADVRKKIYKNLILKMQQDGLLPLPSKPQLKSRLDISFTIQPMA